MSIWGRNLTTMKTLSKQMKRSLTSMARWDCKKRYLRVTENHQSWRAAANHPSWRAAENHPSWRAVENHRPWQGRGQISKACRIRRSRWAGINKWKMNITIMIGICVRRLNSTGKMLKATQKRVLLMFLRVRLMRWGASTIWKWTRIKRSWRLWYTKEPNQPPPIRNASHRPHIKREKWNLAPSQRKSVLQSSSTGARKVTSWALVLLTLT